MGKLDPFLDERPQREEPPHLRLPDMPEGSSQPITAVFDLGTLPAQGTAERDALTPLLDAVGEMVLSAIVLPKGDGGDFLLVQATPEQLRLLNQHFRLEEASFGLLFKTKKFAARKEDLPDWAKGRDGKLQHKFFGVEVVE